MARYDSRIGKNSRHHKRIRMMGNKEMKNDRMITAVRMRMCFIFMLLGIICLSTGCQGLLTTAIILIRGTDTKAKYKFFKGQKVAVVCLAESITDPRFDEVPRNLAKEVGIHLSQNVRKIEMVPNTDVNKWLDRHDNKLEDFQQFGKDIKADMVMVIYLDSFETSSSNSPGSYQGRSSVSFTVYEVSSNKVLASESLSELVYPPNSRKMATDVNESDFRRKYIYQLAWVTSRFFYSYDPKQGMAMDAHAELAM